MGKLRLNKNKLNNGDFIYYLVTSVRDGKKVCSHVVKKLGKRSELIKKHPNIDEYLKEVVIKENNKEDISTKVNLTFSLNKNVKESMTRSYNVGDIFVTKLLNETKLGNLLDQIQSRYKFKYSLKKILTFLLSQRLVDPNSKRKMYMIAKEQSLNDIDFSLEDVYLAMDILIKHKEEILKWLYKHIPCNMKRNYSILYFDGTNTYMETEFEEGLKQRGKGKRNEKEPLVSFGLVLDGSGIPLTFTTFKGSGPETKELIPLEKVISNEFGQADFVMITDAALSSAENKCFNMINNRAYITVQPVRKMSELKLKNYIFDEINKWNTNNPAYSTPDSIKTKYKELSKLIETCEDKNKIIEYEKEIKKLCNVFLTRRYPVLLDKKPKNYRISKKDKFIDEDYLISYSLNYELREKKQRNNLINKALKMINNGDIKKKYKTGDPRQFIKQSSTTNEGEVVENVSQSLNMELIEKQERLDGYYAVSTSLTENKDDEIIFWMKRRWIIEDTFKLMKQFLGFRPINHSKDERINCHFFTVFLTTLFYRYLTKYCNESGFKSIEDMSDDETFDLLRSFKIVGMKGYYFPSFENTIQHQDLQKLFNVNVSHEIMKKAYVLKEYRKLIK